MLLKTTEINNPYPDRKKTAAWTDLRDNRKQYFAYILKY